MKDFETAKNVLVNTSNWSYEDRHFSNRHAWLIAVAALYLLQWPLPIVRAQCPATNWRSGVTEVVGPHGSPDVSGAQGVIYATLSWDPDGPGGMNPWLVVGGDFELKGDFSSQNIAAWDGERWRPMGAGLSGGAVFALAAYDSGNGPELFAGGQFLSSGGEIIRQLARWDGQNWTKLANGLSGSSSNYVAAMIAFDDGTGSQLYFSGNGLGVLRWNGSTLSTIPGPGNAFTMAVFDDGSGPALFVGGRFNATLGNGLNANNIAKWDGASWSALGIGILGNSTSSPSVNSLASFRDANGPALYVGGEFNRAGGVTCSNIAKWSGQSWSALPDPQPFYRVSSMHVFQNGQTESLYMGTGVTGSSSNFYGSLRIWDGTHWQVAPPLSAASSIYGIFGLTTYDDGFGPKLIVGGRFVLPTDTQRITIAAWDGHFWYQIGRGIDGVIYDMAVFDDGTGPAVYAAGSLGQADGVLLGNIARWEGGSWSSLGDGVGTDGYEFIKQLVAFDDGSGPALFAAGDFQAASGVLANGIAKWNGTDWQNLNGGIDGTPYPKGSALAVHDDGQGSALYFSGDFTSIGGVAASGVAMWRGASWSALGSGVTLTSGLGSLYQLLSHDDGNGPALYVRGRFTQAGGVDVADFARWRYGLWEPVGNGPAGTVDKMFLYDNGTGTKLHVIGYYDPPVGSAFYYMSRWDGSTWSTPLSQGNYGNINELAIFDDGCGAALYASGRFFYDPPDSTPGSYQNGIAKWNGTAWHFRAAAPVDQVNKLLTVDEDGGQVLYASGGIVFSNFSVPFQFAHLAILSPSVGAEDINQDLFIDLYDHATIAECLGGPVYPFPSECMNSTDIDADFDVDLADFAAFQNAFAG